MVINLIRAIMENHEHWTGVFVEMQPIRDDNIARPVVLETIQGKYLQKMSHIECQFLPLPNNKSPV